MAQIIGNGDPVNPALATFFDTSFDLTPFGLLDRFEFRADRITRSNLSGTSRISEIAPVGTARPLTEATEANRPTYIAGGSHLGLLDAASFDGSRPDQLDLGDIPATTQTKLLVLRATMPAADNVNMHMLSTTNAGNGRNAMYLRRVTGALTLQAYVGDTPTNGAITNVTVPADTWMALAMTIDTATRTVAAGVRATGQANWTWNTAVYPVGFGPTVTLHSFGARPVPNTTDPFNGRLSGMAVFNGYDLRTNAAMLTNVNNWLFGPTSIFGL